MKTPTTVFTKICLHSLVKIPLIPCGLLLGVFTIGQPANPALAAESQSRTESNCTVGMAKGDKQAECQIPILSGCTVAQFPGYEEPWADISKGGNTSCKFDEKKTDWKTRIVGTCNICKTDQCTGRFIVMFNCSGNVPSASTGSPPPH